MDIILTIGKYFLEIQETTWIENVLKIVIGAFSILLLALSISAYRKTGFRKIVYAIIAFGLFGIQAFFDLLADNVKFLTIEYNDIVLLMITLAILALFFLAVVKRN